MFLCDKLYILLETHQQQIFYNPFKSHIEIIQKMQTTSFAYLTEPPIQHTSSKLNTSAFHLKPSNHQFFSSHKHPLPQLTTLNKFINDDYYANKKIKPGINIYKYIAQGQERQKDKNKISALQLNIPSTLICCDNSYQRIYTDSCGRVRTQPDIQPYKWFDILTSHNYEPDVPIALQAIGASVQLEYSIVMEKDQSQKIMPKSQTQAVSKYMIPYAKFPNILRLFYHPERVKTTKKSIGYKMVNKQKINDQLLSKKHKLLHYFVVDVERKESYERVLVKGKALQQVEVMTQSLVDYLQSLKGCKISQIVVDYILDRSRVYWFHQVLSIKSVNSFNLWDHCTREEIIEFSLEQNNHIKCRLCNFLYPKRQVNNKVTYKLIFQILAHLKNRGIKFSSDLPSFPTNFSANTNVCDLCFELIAAEHKLIATEKQFCKFINVQLCEQTPDKGEKSQKNIQLQVSDLLDGITVKPNSSTRVYEWRFFFHIEKIRCLPKIESKDMIFSMKFKTEVQRHRIRVQKEENFSSSRATHYTNRTQELAFGTSQEVKIEKVKVFILHTQHQNIQATLRDEELSFELKIANELYRGSSATLQHFSNSKGCQRHSCQILLFNDELNHCILDLTVGLVCDGLTDASNPNNDRGERVGKCSPLPQEWVQVLDAWGRRRVNNEQ